MKLFSACLGMLMASRGALALGTSQKPLDTEIEGSVYEIEAPGIGFDLSPTYGTVSIKYKNGTVLDAGKIEGDLDYIDLLEQLSKEGTRFQPPFDNPDDRLKWEQQQAKRRRRKLHGFPATEEIGILAYMISSLKDATQSLLAQEVTEAAVTIPILPMLVIDDLDEAFDYAGVKKLTLPWFWEEVDEVMAAHFGMGYGLCAHPEDRHACREEEIEMPEKLAVAIGFTNASLTVSIVDVYYGRRPSERFQHRDDFLGFRNADLFPEFWDEVGTEIKEVASYFRGYFPGKVNEVLIYGEAGEEKMFLDKVWEILGDMQSADSLSVRAADLYSTIQVSHYNALYVSARGAAELGQRARVWNRINIGTGRRDKEDISTSPQYLTQKGKVDSCNVSLNLLSWGIKNMDGRQVQMTRKSVLESTGLDPRAVEEAVKIAQNIAEDERWRIEVVDIVGEERELWIFVDEVRQCVLVLENTSEVVVKREQSLMTETSVLASNEGMIVDASAQLQLDIDSEVLHMIRDRAKRAAGDHVWWIEVIDWCHGDREFWSVIDGRLAFVHGKSGDKISCSVSDWSAEKTLNL